MRPMVITNVRDLSQVVQSNSVMRAATAGKAKWGPVGQPVLVSDLDHFVRLFGPPIDNTTYPMYYQAFGYFQGSKDLYVVRPQGGSKHGGAESNSSTKVLTALGTGIDALPANSAASTVGIYAKYPGVHPSGTIYAEIDDSNNTAGTFTLLLGTKVADNHLVATHKDFERHEVSVVSGLTDGYGRSKWLPDVLERDSQLAEGRVSTTPAVADTPVDTTVAVALAGAVYASPSSGDVVTAANLLKSKSLNIKILFPSEEDTDIQNAMIEVADALEESFATTCSKATDDTKTKVLATLALLTKSKNTSFTANAAQFKDLFNDKTVTVPCAGFVAGAYANSEALAGDFAAPAGARRTQLRVTPVYNWSDSDKDDFAAAQVNWIEKSPTKGVYLQGNATTYPTTSSLQDINVVRLLQSDQKTAREFLEDFLNELNTAETRLMVESQLQAHYDARTAAGAYYETRVVCNGSNNSDLMIDQKKLVVDIYVKPVRSINWIYLNAIVTSTGVDFADLIQS